MTDKPEEQEEPIRVVITGIDIPFIQLLDFVVLLFLAVLVPAMVISFGLAVLYILLLLIGVVP